MTRAAQDILCRIHLCVLRTLVGFADSTASQRCFAAGSFADLYMCLLGVLW